MRGRVRRSVGVLTADQPSGPSGPQRARHRVAEPLVLGGAPGSHPRPDFAHEPPPSEVAGPALQAVRATRLEGAVSVNDSHNPLIGVRLREV